MILQYDIDYFCNKFTFWDHLTEAQKSSVISDSTYIHYEKDAAIHDAAQDCLGLLLLKSGMFRIYMLSEEGREITLYRLEAGDVCVLSASCILKSITFDVHIDASVACDVIQIGPILLSDLLKNNIYVDSFLYHLATERFSDVMWAMQQILFMSFDKRLAIFLFDEISKTKNDTLSMTHDQIARYTGSAREVVSRMLKYFSKEGIVILSRGGVTVIDKQKLRSLTL